MTTLNVFLIFFAISISVFGYSTSGLNIDPDLYEFSSMDFPLEQNKILKQQEQLRDLQQLADASNLQYSPYKQFGLVSTEKRAKNCIKRDAICNSSQDNCCSGSVCRCTLISIGGSTCKCKRQGLFQKFNKFF